MADWTYVPGETVYNQDFDLFVKKDPFVVTGFSTIKMYIATTNGTSDFPVGGTTMSITASDDNNRVRLAITSAFMPQLEEMYFTQIELVDGASQVRKTFTLDLNVEKDVSS